MKLYESITNNLTEAPVDYDAEEKRIQDLAKSIRNIISHTCPNARVDWHFDGTDRWVDINSCRFPAESFSKYENEVQIYGDLHFDENLNLIKADLNTSSGPNILNGQFISCLNSLYTFFKSNGQHYDA